VNGVDDHGFAGDVLLALAREGRLVLDADTADSLIKGLEEALDFARIRALGNHMRTSPSWSAITERFPGLDRLAVDAAFIEQMAPGRTERAVRELPKYIEALRLAKASRPAR
jgi:hypothetical protein